MGNLVDVDAALEELGLDKEDFVEFSQDLKEFSEENIPKIDECIKNSDYQALKEAAHSIKGAMANLRFVEVASIAYKLETIGHDGSGMEDAAGIFDQLKQCIADSFAEIDKL